MQTQDTADESAKAVGELAQVQPFCTDRLPEWLRDYTGELSLRYTVPQADLTLACLATAGTVVGPRAKAELGWGAQPTASNLLVVMKPEVDANLEKAIQHVVAPVAARQNEILRRRGKFNDFKLERKLEILPPKMRHAFLSDADLRKYLKEAGNLLRTAKPALLIGSLDRETLLHSLSQSADGTLFMCNELAMQGDACPLEGNCQMDMDLVQRCLNRLPVIESFGQTRVGLAEPVLGGILVATPHGLHHGSPNSGAVRFWAPVCFCCVRPQKRP